MEVSDQARQLQSNALIWDMTLPYTDYGDPELKVAMLRRMAENGFDVVSLTVGGDWMDLPSAIRSIAKERHYFLGRPDTYVLIESTDDITRARRENKLAVVFHFQGANPIAHDLAMVEVYYKLGIRHMLMCYNVKTPVGDGCQELTDGGLSRLGADLVKEMNRVGMLVDVAHTGYRTSMDVFDASSEPVIISHANARALCDHTRNVRDDQIKACAASGGLIGVNGVGVFLGDNDASTEMVLSHVDYLAELVGPEHVGLGTDYIDGAERRALPATGSLFNPREVHEEAHLRASGGTTRGPSWDKIEYFAPEQAPQLSEAMLKRGYSEADVRGVLGENFLRVARRVWK